MVTPGDLDGDGYGELAIGAPSLIVGGQYRGGAYLVSGADLPTDVHVLFAYATIEGAVEGGRLGQSVAAPGDMDGDGHADLVVGDSRDGVYAYNGGGVHVYWGPFSGSLEAADADAHFYGDTQEAAAGHTLDSPGDLTGDGLLDLVIGGKLAEGDAQYSGVAWVLAGGEP